MINKRGEIYNEIGTTKRNEVRKFFNGVLWLLVAVISVIVIYVLVFKK